MHHAVRLVCVLVVLGLLAPPAHAQSRAPSVSIVYTGRSLGALGVLREDDERELVIEYARRTNQKVSIGTFTCWRAAGLALVAPGRDLSATDLDTLLAAGRPPAGSPAGALRSNNITLLEDPARSPSDLLAIIKDSPRAPVDFPDLESATVRVTTVQIASGPAFLIVDENAAWTADAGAWTPGEFSIIRAGDRAVFDLPVNLGEMGPRATLLRRAVDGARARGSLPVLVDLGERDGDLGMPRDARAALDYGILRSLGYRFVVPYELELALGQDGLRTLSSAYPEISFLAANIKTIGPSVFKPHDILEVNGVRIGVFGLVDPELAGVLASSALKGVVFESPILAASREIKALHAAGVNAVIALSNLHPRDNALLSREVAGLDAVVADLHVRWSPEELDTSVTVPEGVELRPGSPALVARSLANGLGIGVLDLEFQKRASGRVAISHLASSLRSVTDRVPADASVVREIRKDLAVSNRTRGDVMFPDFERLAALRPALLDYDTTTALGRVSKRMWEEFLARLVRNGAGAEVAVLRKLPHFPQATGDLHESDVRSWLWTEDAIVVLDLPGAELKRLLTDPTNSDLVASGLNAQGNRLNGRRIEDSVLYRVATTDLLVDGARAQWFASARRVARHFTIGPAGRLLSSRNAAPIGVRDYVLSELHRLRRELPNDAYQQRLASLLSRDEGFVPLFSFTFDHPTVFGSLNQVTHNEPYASVPESRVTSRDSGVFGMSGRFLATYDRRRVAIDFGVTTAFAQQRSHLADGTPVVSQSADDLRFDVTSRWKAPDGRRWPPQPFVRAQFDTEFSATVNSKTGFKNPRQRIVRGVGGIVVGQRPGFPDFEAGVIVEDDMAQQHFEAGISVRSEYRHRFGTLGRLSYRLLNDFAYYFPGANDNVTDLGLTYAMTHELLIPLADELALSVGGDIFLFRGKVDATRTPGLSTIIRVGLSYDRLWKPRYQPFF